MSITPVREALRILQADGLVSYDEHRAISVADLTSEDADEVYTLRAMLESLATTRAVERCDESDKETIRLAHDAMLAAVGGGDNNAIRRANQRWHFAIYSAARTRYVHSFVVRLWTRFDWNSSWDAPGRLTESVKEHQMIMDALLSGSAELAGVLMRQHITGGYIAGRTARGDSISTPPKIEA